MRHSKGQYRIISEIILFSVGILITGYVIVNFNSLQDSTMKITFEDQMNSVADVVATAVIKVAHENNASVRLVIPDKISDSIYMIALREGAEGDGELIITKLDGTESVRKKLFNINHDNTITSNNVINNSEVVSSAQFIEIVKNEKITILRR
ncbi:MAG: hypothetical protein QT00_C0002G0235 [archaeon GW2011_AR5]|nr:MAG: hypothetical protein QT00_C0002G0235 [archaeon GW2011_AR5]